MRALITAIVVAWSTPALAQTTLGDEPLAAWEALESLPPGGAWEIGVHVNYGTIAWFDEMPWLGFGLRGGWGRLTDHSNRLGAGVALNLEGPVPIYYSASIEPQVTWDRVRGGLQLGASVGPSVMIHSELEPAGAKVQPSVGPMAALRLGYSERWSRAGRRFYAYVEPKGRMIPRPDEWVSDLSVAIVVGSGRGLN